MLDRVGVLLGEVSKYRKFKHLSLNGFDDQNQPDHQNGQTCYDSNEHYEKRSDHRNKEKNIACELKRDCEQYRGTGAHETLQRMKSYVPIFSVGLKEKENDCRDKREIGKRSDDIFGKTPGSPRDASLGPHGATATWAESSSVRHLGGAVRARSQLDWGLVHRGRHIKRR